MAAAMSTQTIAGVTLFFVPDEGPELAGEEDALELLGLTYGTGTDMLVVPAARFAPGFFDLATRQAGLFFQKMQNYSMRLAILGDMSRHVDASRALHDFVGETNRIGHHLFVPDRAGLVAALERTR